MRQILPAFVLGLCLLLSALPTPPANAEVVDSGPGGFTTVNTAQVAAAPEEVYDKLVGDVARWWNGSHTFSADAANLSIDATPGGCFHERLPRAEGEDGWLCHLRVIHAHPGRLLRLSGGLGPLQEHAVTGSLSWSLEERDGGGTTITWKYAVGGYFDGGLASWAAPVDGVLAEQLGRFGRYLETGSPEPAAESPASP
jgi:hypothetical protein